MVAVPVNPQVLVWARTERGLTGDEAAQRLKINLVSLLGLERGEREPTLGELERIASQYQIPLVSLLMPNPLPPVSGQRPKLRDFRAFDGFPAADLSHETLIAIEEAYSYADSLEELRDTDPSLIPPPRLPVYKLNESAAKAAASERLRIGIQIRDQLDWLTHREAFLRWREAVEAQGVFAYQLRLGADDARGFAIWDERQIPIVVIDSAEGGYPAKIFTIWHEYAHILLRAGGISNQNNRDETERFCNRFAANFLMPPDDFIREANGIRQTLAPWSEAHLKRLADRFKVSLSAAAIQFEYTELAHDGFYREMLSIWRLRQPPASSGRATHIEKHANRLSGSHVRTVLAAVEKGR